MKNLILFFLFSLANSANAQSTNGIYGNYNWMSDWTNFKPKTTEYKKPTEVLSGIIESDKTLLHNKTYILSGIVYVTNNAKLIIEAGTVIRGDYESCGTLVITKGSFIIAEGQSDNPIVFTSSKGVSERNPGDWGGIIILGDASINRLGGIGLLGFDLNQKICAYGGNNDNSNSGILKYVRIEFPGRKLNSLKELNGLSLAGVGNKTKIEFVQVSFSNDDSFESYGGNLTLNNLISYRSTDDDFDFTQGTQCTISNSLAIRYPYSSDANSTSRCFEIDTFDKPDVNDYSKKLTTINAINVTLVNNEDNNEGLIKEAIYISDKSNFSMESSVVSGFSKLLLLDKKIQVIPVNLERIKFNGVLVNSCFGIIESENTLMNPEVAAWFKNLKFGIKPSKITNTTLFADSVNKAEFDFRLKTSTELSYK